MADDQADRIYAYAMGLGEARVKDSDAIEELVTLAGNRAQPLEEALERTRKQVSDLEAEASTGTDDAGPPEAPALLASKLLEEALAALSPR